MWIETGFVTQSGKKKIQCSNVKFYGLIEREKVIALKQLGLSIPVFGKLFVIATKPIFLSVTLVSTNLSEAFAEGELTQFFPSEPIHEDDSLLGTFEATVTGCNIKLTKTSGYFVTVSNFDVQDYETDLERLYWPKAQRISTRYRVPWFVRRTLSAASIDDINSKLDELSLYRHRLAVLSPDEVQRNMKELQNWLSEVRSGVHGTFAQNNHTAVYLTKEGKSLISVRVNSDMRLPVQSTEMSALAQAMHQHSLTCDRD